MKESPPRSIDETYSDVEALVWDTTLKFHRKHGGDLEEQIAIANLAFVEAYAKHNIARAAFTTIVVLQIRWLLLESLGRELKYRKATQSAVERWPVKREPAVSRPVNGNGDLDLDRLPSWLDRSSFDLDELQVSPDARRLVQFVLEMEDSLQQESRSCRKGLRAVVSNVLQGLGWTAQRIAESFTEIQEALR